MIYVGSFSLHTILFHKAFKLPKGYKNTIKRSQKWSIWLLSQRATCTLFKMSLLAFQVKNWVMLYLKGCA